MPQETLVQSLGREDSLDLPYPRQPTPIFLPAEPPWTEKPGGLQSMGLPEVGHDWSDLACMFKQEANRRALRSEGAPLPSSSFPAAQSGTWGAAALASPWSPWEMQNVHFDGESCTHGGLRSCPTQENLWWQGFNWETDFGQKLLWVIIANIRRVIILRAKGACTH